MSNLEDVLGQRIRVLFVNHTAKLGGGELALGLLIRHLDRTQLDLQTLLFEDGPLVELLKPDTVVHIVTLSESIRSARKDTLTKFSWETVRKIVELPLFVLRLRAVILRMQVDLVHTNSLKADILGGLAGRLAGKKVVWHVRDRIENDYLPTKVVSMFRRLVRMIPDGIIANSGATLQSLRLPDRLASRRPALASVIHDGFDIRTLVSEAPSKGQPLLVGLIGRITPWKGQDVFIRAIHRVHACLPEVRFQIIGSALFGEELYEQELRALSANLGLDDCVEFCGFVREVQQRIAILDLVVHASTISEPFGQVVIEGMAAGKAVIATRGGGVSEIVEDGVSGVLVPKNDPVALADAMLQLLNDSSRRQALGVEAHLRVQNHFRIEFTAAKVLRFYQELAPG